MNTEKKKVDFGEPYGLYRKTFSEILAVLLIIEQLTLEPELSNESRNSYSSKKENG